MNSQNRQAQILRAVLLVSFAFFGAGAFGDDQTKSPVPAKPAVASAAESLRTRYATQLRNARTFQQRQAFASKLVIDASNEADVATRYAILRLALQHAMGSRSPGLALRVIDQLEAFYVMDARSLRVETLRTIVAAAKTNAQRRAAFDTGIKLVKTSLARTPQQDLVSLAESLPLLARRLRDDQRRVEAEELIVRVKRAVLERRQIAAAEQRLADSPNDADANYTLALAGFGAGQWSDAVRQLAKSGQHPQLAQLAQQDLRGAETTQQFLALADRWAKAANERSELGGLRGRALYWMHRAIPRTNGDERKVLEDRTAAISAKLKSWKAEHERVASHDAKSERPKAQSTQSPDDSASHSNSTTASQANAPAVPSKCEIVHRFDAHRGPVHDVGFHPKHPWMVTCGEDGLIHIWNVNNRQKELTLEGHRGPVFAVAFSPDGRRLASVGGDKSLRIWRLPSPGRLGGKVEDPVVLQGHTTRVRDVVFAHSGEYVLTCADDHRVMFWDIKTGGSVAREGHKGIVYALAPTRRDNTAASVGEDGRVQLWNRFAAGASWLAHRGKATAVAIAPNEKVLATGGDDQSILLWNLKSGVKSELPKESSAINCLVFSNQSKLLASVSRGRVVKIWRYADQQQIGECLGLQDEALALAFSGDDKRIAAADRSGKVTLWRTPVEE